MYSDEFIEKVRSNSDLKRVFEAKGITLRKSGADLVCKCPFHSDKNPSLHVNLAKGLWNCFGCGEGGDAIQFVRRAWGYSFREAIEYLANMENIPIEEDEQLTDEQREEMRKREVLLNAMDVVADYYVSTLWNSQNSEAKKALEEASDRWDKEFLQRYRIGYATFEWTGLIDYAASKGYSGDVLLELGMAKYSKKNHLIDAFRGRIMIPIRSRSGRTIAFTGRIIKEHENDEHTGKYINNTGTPLYDKDKSVFGIDVAAGPAIHADVIYLVEGAPDVLRLHQIGVLNTVACLGSSWTENQLRQLKRCTTNLCFIPDADPPNPEATNIRDKHGIGIQAVVKNAKKALELGFKVKVKEIPVGEKQDSPHRTTYFKQDPDSYFKSIDKFNHTGEEDFIIWYAGKILDARQATSENAKAMEELAALISDQDIESQIPLYIEALNNILPGRQAWKKAIEKAKGERSRQSLSRDEDSIAILSEYGFVERHNAYYTSSNGSTVKWSNFTLRPLFHVRDNNSALRLYKMKNEDGVELTIEFQQEELTSLARFRAKVESQGNFVWLVGETQLTKLKQYLYKATETAELVKQLGWNHRGFFSFGNGIAFMGTWYKVDALGIVRLPEDKGNYYLPAFSEVHLSDEEDNSCDFDRRFIHEGRSSTSLFEYTSQMVTVFGNKAIVGICFLLASLFRDIILKEVTGFPILNLFGPKGSGKTELGHSLMAFFMTNNKAPNLTTSTLPTLAEAVGQVSNALIHLDEFRTGLDTEKYEFLKGLWDSVGRSRMNIETGKKRETSRVNCGIIVSGQELASKDIALFSRFVFLSFATYQFTKEELHELEKFREIRKRGCSHLTLDIIKLRPQFEQGFRQAYYDVTDQLSSKYSDTIEGRIMGNWAILIAAFKTLENYLKLPFDYAEAYQQCCALMEVQNKYCRANNEIAHFWQTVSLLVNQGKLYEDCDFHIKHVDKLLLKVDRETNTTRVLDCVKPVLMVRFPTVFEQYKDYCISHNEAYLSSPSLKQYLQAAKDYIGTKAKQRFTPMLNGEIVYVEQPKKGKKGTPKEYVGEALCFDYDLACELYEFSLVSKNISVASADDDEEPS